MTALALAHTEHAPDGAETLPPLLVVHGLFGSERNWNTLAGRLARGRRVVTADMRNHGASPWSDEMTYPAMAADLARLIDERCGGRAAVLGHSMGGKAAMTLAIDRPDRVAALVVADIAPVAYGHSHAPQIEAMRSLDLAAVTRRAEADRMLADRIPDRGLRGFLLQNLLIEGGTARWRLNLDVLGAGMETLTGFPALDGRYDGPALFLHGGASDYVPPDSHDTIRSLFPAAEIEAIAGAGHWLHAEKPDAFLAAVAGWLDFRQAE